MNALAGKKRRDFHNFRLFKNVTVPFDALISSKPPRRHIICAIAIGILSLTGCPSSHSSSSTTSAEKMPLAGVKLTLAVVGDTDFAASITRLQGEWNSQTGADFQVLQLSNNELAETKSQNLPADAVLCDPRFISIFAEQKLIAPVPSSMQKTPQWADVFDLLREKEVAWGGDIVAVPFGSPVFVIYYRADLLEGLNRKPPQTWAEYLELAKLLGGMKQSTPDLALERNGGTVGAGLGGIGSARPGGTLC